MGIIGATVRHWYETKDFLRPIEAAGQYSTALGRIRSLCFFADLLQVQTVDPERHGCRHRCGSLRYRTPVSQPIATT